MTTLTNALAALLSRLASDGPDAVAALSDADGGLTIELNHPTAHVTLLLADHDRFSVALRELQIGAAVTEVGDVRSQLSEIAAAVARRLNFLEEPLAVWELEPSTAEAQLRSAPPQRENQDLIYWEVVVRGGANPGARLARYRWSPELVEREQVTYPTTFRFLGRVAETLAGALQPTE